MACCRVCALWFGAAGQGNAAPYAPPRNKTHWDHVLEEMEWLAKEFIKERGWKQKQAKRWSAHAIKSNLSLENRHAHRLQQEEAAARKTAKNVAAQVHGRAGAGGLRLGPVVGTEGSCRCGF